MARHGKFSEAGYLYKRGRVYWMQFKADGKRVRVSTNKTTEREAVEVLRQYAEVYRKGQEGNDAVKRARTFRRMEEAAAVARVPLAALLETYQASPFRKAVADTTWKHYAGRIAAFVAWMQKKHPEMKDAGDVTLKTACDFLKAVTEGRATPAKWEKARGPKTFNDYRAILKQTWDALIKAGSLEINPWAEIDTKTRDTHGKKELDESQLEALYAAAPAEFRPLFMIGLYTGLRLKDAALLRWIDIDLKAGFISTEPFKTSRHGTRVDIPILPPLRKTLEEAAARCPGRKGFVLPSIAGRYQRNSKYLSTLVQNIFTAAGIETTSKDDDARRAASDYGFHSSRHTFVSLAFRYGVPLPIVQAIVGHTNAAMTRHYLHISRNQLAEAMGGFQALPLDAAAAPADGEAAETPPTPGEERRAAFVAAWEAMTDEERAAALEAIGISNARAALDAAGTVKNATKAAKGFQKRNPKP